MSRKLNRPNPAPPRGDAGPQLTDIERQEHRARARAGALQAQIDDTSLERDEGVSGEAHKGLTALLERERRECMSSVLLLYQQLRPARGRRAGF